MRCLMGETIQLSSAIINGESDIGGWADHTGSQLKLYGAVNA